MLTIKTGPAGTGKTQQIMQEIKNSMNLGGKGMLLIVPEQYSHEAERQLCAVCGDSLSLHAEVLSFTGLCRHVFAETGAAALKILDKSGQILVLHRAIESVRQTLKVYGVKKTRIEMLESLLTSVNEFKSMRITPQKLKEMAQSLPGSLSEKLTDFALIMDAYDALMQNYGGDSAQRLSLLAAKIGQSSVGSGGHIYFDGFNDFTAQEMQIIKELLKKGSDVTVCISCRLDDGDPAAGSGEVFEIPRRTIASLSHLGQIYGGYNIDTVLPDYDSAHCPELKFIEEHLFDDTPPRFTGDFGSPFPHPLPGMNLPVVVYAAPSRYTQCEYAAAVILNVVRSGNRWRDIGVMARDLTDYESICEHVFDKYGIPYFTSGKVDIRCRPPIALIDAALEIATMGWEYKSVFRYLKTGLLPLTEDDVAMLENYVIKWNIRGSLWQKKWIMPPSGYKTGHSSKNDIETDKAALEKLNNLRELVIKPLRNLEIALKGKKKNNPGGDTAAEVKLRALYEFMEEISLSENLSETAKSFEKSGQLRLADEYRQLSDIIIDAMDQMYTVIGAIPLSAVEFRKLIMLVLSRHDVGVIPISLDRVALGTMTMSRRRDLKCLIILGATDENLPRLGQSSGVLSDNERRVLSKLDSSIPSGLEERLYREMNMIYSVLTLAKDRLVMIYETAAGARPSFIVSRLCEMFSIEAVTLKEDEYMNAAPQPYEELLGRKDSHTDTSVRAYLSPATAQKLYGSSLVLSATRADAYFSCPYKHFLQTGLRLRPRKPAQFDAASAGSFMHYVLEGVMSTIKANPGFSNVDDSTLSTLAAKYAQEYVNDVLLGFEGKNERFQYLFRRYEQSLLHVIRDMVNELKNSQFIPYEFETDISKLSDAHRGFIDRVDVYETEGKIYYRVIDYKTRRKAYGFNLCDVAGGRDMQMLIYLFTLKKYGELMFGKKPQPAGVLYVPARDIIISAPRDASGEEIDKLRVREMQRSGLVLNDYSVIEAMEGGCDKKFLPVKTAKDGSLKGESLVSMEQINILEKFVDAKMDEAKNAILSGANDCKPYYKNSNDNACIYCEYSEVCRFDEQLGDRCRYAGKMTGDEVWTQIGTSI